MKNDTFFTPNRFQRIIQTLFLFYSIYIGWKFYHFILWASGQTDLFTSRPASVEAFLPISALVALRNLIHTHHWDIIHPAGLSIFLAAIAISFFFRKAFCGYICPIGLVSGWLNWMGEKIHLSKIPPRWLDYLLQLVKYVLLTFFVWMVIFQISSDNIQSFLHSPYNLLADARMLHFFSRPSAITLGVITVLIISGVAVRSFWCRYLCPYGALLGLFSKFSPVHINRDKEKCIQCKKCVSACPAGIDVNAREKIISTECIGCLRCYTACPEKGCLSVRLGSETIPWWSIGAGAVVMFLLLWLIALSFGLWHSSIPEEVYRMLYQKLM